jgi:hypothetical protein
MRGFTSFLEVLWSCSAIDEGKVLLDVVYSWEKPIGPDWFAMPSSLRILGFSCSRTESSLLMLMHRRKHIRYARAVTCRAAVPGCSSGASFSLAQGVALPPFPASCDDIRIGLPPPRAERFRTTLADALVQFSPDLRLRLAALHSPLLPS